MAIAGKRATFTVRVWACAARLRSTPCLTGGPMFSPLIEAVVASSFLFILQRWCGVYCG